MLADCTLAVALLVLRVVAIHEWAEAEQPPPTPPGWHHALIGLAITTVVVRRRFPRTVFVIACVLATVLDLLPYPTWIGVWVLACAIYTVASSCSTRWSAVVTVLSLAPAVAPVFVAPGMWQSDYAMVLVMLNVSIVVLGQVVRRSRQRAVRLKQALELLEQAQQRLTSETVLVERSRIARELHDIVAHGLSLITVRAGVARMLLPEDPVQAKEAVQIIENVARESSAEMRHMLDALRSTDEHEKPEFHPQPGLDRLDELVRSVGESGLPVDVVRRGSPRPLPPGQELAVYRILQETLSNALKHTGTVRVTATLDYRADRLVIEVFSETSRHQESTAADESSHSLLGVHERVALYGGTVQVDAVRDGFRITAELPVDAA